MEGLSLPKPHKKLVAKKARRPTREASTAGDDESIACILPLGPLIIEPSLQAKTQEEPAQAPGKIILLLSSHSFHFLSLINSFAF